MVLIVNTYNDDCDNWEQCDDNKYLYKWSGAVKNDTLWWHWEG